jgi:hypothetical protein
LAQIPVGEYSAVRVENILHFGLFFSSPGSSACDKIFSFQWDRTSTLGGTSIAGILGKWLARAGKRRVQMNIQ